jgi:hypothetical protein
MILLKQTAPQLVKKDSEFYVKHRFITVFKTARHLSLFWTKLTHSELSHVTQRFLSFSFPIKIPPVPYTVTSAAHLIIF